MNGLRSHIFFVDDVTSAAAWYRLALGKEPYFDQPFYTGFEVGGYELGLQPSSEVKRPGVGGDRGYWGVDDADATVARLVVLGASVLEAVEDVGGGIRIGAVRDPFGNALGLIFNPHFHAGVVNVVPYGARLAATAGDVSDRTIVTEVVVPATPAQVWPLWTTSEGLASWLVPADVELRIGGKYEWFFRPDAPYGLRGGEHCRVLSWIPERMISFTWNAPPEQPLTRPQHTWVVVELEAVPDGTRIRLTHTGWPAAGLADAAGPWVETFAYFERAWGSVMRELAGAFAGS